MSLSERMDTLTERTFLHATVEPLGDIAIRSLSENESSALRFLAWDDMRDKEEAELKKAERDNMRLTNARLIQYTLCDPETHKLIYSDDPEHSEHIAKMNAQVIGTLVALIDRHCGYRELNEKDIDLLVKNSEGTHEDTLHTLSPVSVAG